MLFEGIHMADIEITCPKCSHVTTVSEFIAPDSLVCHSCGEKLQKPETASPKPKPALQRLRIQEPEPAVTEEKKADQAPKEWRFYKHTRKEKKPKRRFRLSHHAAGWIIFVVLAGTMGFMRYGGGLSADHIKLIKQFGPAVVIAIHALIVLKAFKDSVFQGILCLLIPLYSFYYLFLVSDDFYLRAIIGGVLIGIGQDSFDVLKDNIIAGFRAVDAWIQSGG